MLTCPLSIFEVRLSAFIAVVTLSLCGQDAVGIALGKGEGRGGEVWLRGKERSGVSGLGTLSICQTHHSIPSILLQTWHTHINTQPSTTHPYPAPPPIHYSPHQLTTPHTYSHPPICPTLTPPTPHTHICRQTRTPTHLLLVGELYLAHWWRSVAVLWLWVVPTGSQRGGRRGRTEGDRGKTTWVAAYPPHAHTYVRTHTATHTHARTHAHTHTATHTAVSYPC